MTILSMLLILLFFGTLNPKPQVGLLHSNRKSFGFGYIESDSTGLESERMMILQSSGRREGEKVKLNAKLNEGK